MDTYLRSIERDAAIIIDVAQSMPLDTSVPSCPGWTLGDLVVHTGIVHRHKTETVAGGWLDEAPPEPEEPDGDVVMWFAAGVDEMLEVFRLHDLSRPTWTWCIHDHKADWWVRRMAHETAIHGVDAQSAVGEPPSLDPELATDGVDEILVEMMTGGPDWSTVTPMEGVVELATPDRRWGLRRATLSGTSPSTGTRYEALDTFVFDEAKPDTVIGAEPSTLDLWLWGRAPLSAGSVSGDPSLADQVRAVAAEATQ